MAHFAKIDRTTNTVTGVIVVNNETIEDLPFPESEPVGLAFIDMAIKKDPNEDIEWKQTSYNSNFRYNYAEVGGTYSYENDAFIRVKPYSSWVLDSNFRWVSPVPYPADGISKENPNGKFYFWHDESLTWVDPIYYEIDEETNQVILRPTPLPVPE